ncbi:MAG: acetyl-CoA carboxylase biotin carboxyl carrier protein [Planctomycetota bacterium]|jgi:acetyl-CoA carboxylase biotin carboxyl carrier protein|nr:acetyl-CoA carboxylase biotin carboxyl carrier protein [Planctomycetota bacterium]
MDVKTIRELTRLMRDYELVELEVESEDLRVRLSKAAGAAVMQAAPMVAAPAAPAAAAASAAEAAPAADEFAGCTKITSPIPGTVYLKPNPESDSFCTVGSQVKDGDVVCLIEAMKVFNEIKSEGVAGTVKKVCVEDGQAVEYGTVLYLVG